MAKTPPIKKEKIQAVEGCKVCTSRYFWPPWHKTGWGLQNYAVITPIRKKCIKFNNRRLKTLQIYDLHKLTEFYTEWFSVYPSITSNFRIIAMFRCFVNKVMIQIRLIGMSIAFTITKFIFISENVHELPPQNEILILILNRRHVCIFAFSRKWFYLKLSSV
jgi:hypothetical protein